MNNSQPNDKDFAFAQEFIEYMVNALGSRKLLKEAIETREPFKAIERSNIESFINTFLAGQAQNVKEAIGDSNKDRLCHSTIYKDDTEALYSWLMVMVDSLLNHFETNIVVSHFKRVDKQIKQQPNLSAELTQELTAITQRCQKHKNDTFELLIPVITPYINTTKKFPLVDDGLITQLNKAKDLLSNTDLRNYLKIKLSVSEAISTIVEELKSRIKDKATSDPEKQVLTNTVCELEVKRCDLLRSSNDTESNLHSALNTARKGCNKALTNHENTYYSTKGKKIPTWFNKAKAKLLCAFGPLLQLLNKERRQSTAEITQQSRDGLKQSFQALNSSSAGMFSQQAPLTVQAIAEELGKQFETSITTHPVHSL